MKIVLLTNGSEHGYRMLKHLAEVGVEIDTVLFEKKRISKKEVDLLSSKSKILSLAFKLIPRFLVDRVYPLYRRYKRGDYPRKKFKELCRQLEVVDNFNGTACFDKLKELKPDILVLGGTRIIKEHILSIPTTGTLNAHPGLLPHYRGLDVISWALYQGDDVGVTVHFVDPGIDTGEIVIQRKLIYSPEDSLGEIKKKAILLSAELMGEAVLQAMNTKKPVKTIPNPSSQGRYYQKMPVEILNQLKKNRNGKRI